MRQVIAQLERIRRRGRAMLLVQRLAVIIAWALGLTLGLMGVDYLLRLPATVRLVLLVGAGGVLVGALRAYLWPAVRFRPSLTELALRAEGSFPAVAGRLASSVEFAVSGLDRTNTLAGRSVRETERRLSGESLADVLSAARTWRGLAAMLGIIAVVTAVAVTSPTEARTGFARLFAPYGGTQWPARTGLESLMSEVVPLAGVHPRGQVLPLRVRVTKGDPPRVDAHIRVQVDGRWNPWQRMVLTHQGDKVYERLVDTNAEAVEVYFEARDARTKAHRITLVAPPAVHRATLTITPPSYASHWYRPLEADLGPGLDDRAVTDTPSLVGSEAQLLLELNKPIPIPSDPQQFVEALGWEGGDPPTCTVDERSPSRWLINWRVAGTRSLRLQLVDVYGLANAEPIAYRIEAVDDRLPAVTIVEPESDEVVLATAVVPLVAEARDDVAVATVGVEATLQRRDQQPTAGQPVWETSRAVEAPTASVSAELDLALLALAAGDVVLVRGVGEDVFELDGRRHPTVRSAARRLRIISELDLAHQLRRELGVVRQNAIRIEALQAELQDDVIEDGVQLGMQRAQALTGERIADQREVVDRLQRRIDLNRLDDQQLSTLVQQTGNLLDFAGRAANRAVEAIEQRQAESLAATPAGDVSSRRTDPGDRRAEEAPTRRQPRGDDAMADEDAPGVLEALDALHLREPDERDRPIVEAQQEVREELADLITMLDRDEDTWVATRRLEDLARAQGQLEVDTSALGQRTIGRSADELTAAEQSELSRIAQRQGELAQQGRQLIEDLHRRANDLEDVDPQAAAAMRVAATTAEQRELTPQMDEASQRLQQNQMRTAQAAQQAALRTLQRMLRDIRENKRATAEELLRRLANLIESIQRLVFVQETELSALTAARESGQFTGRDRAMIRLNQNTQAVATQARTTGQEARRVARLLDRAADAQGAAVVALRTQPADVADAEVAENRSLELLQEAESLALELEQVIEQRELLLRREEIIAAYREYAEQQAVVRSETVKLVGPQELDRRRLSEARRLGRAQEEIGVGLDELRVRTPDLHRSLIFSHVHELIDKWSGEVTDALVAGVVEADIADRQQRIVDSIGRLITALEELMQPPGEFAQGGGNRGGGGGGGGAQPLIPPAAELRLLRGMQEQVYDLTRRIDGRADLRPPQRSARLQDLGRSQRALRDLGQQLLEQLQLAPRDSDPTSEGSPP